MIVDYSRNSNTVTIKRKHSMVEISKQFLKRADCDDLKKHFSRLSKNIDSSYSIRSERTGAVGRWCRMSRVIHTYASCICSDILNLLRQFSSLLWLQKVMIMPLRYEVIGYKSVAQGDSFMTVFFLLVRLSTTLWCLCIVHCVNDWMIEWLNDWMIEWLNDWMIEWLIDWLIERR
jgi:hypothetical protein